MGTFQWTSPVKFGMVIPKNRGFSLTHELIIEVAGHPISLELEGDAFLDPIREAYQRFFSDKHPEWCLRIFPDDSLAIREESSVGLTFSNEKVRIVDDYLMGFINLGSNDGEVRVNPVWFMPSLATFIRNLFTLILVLKDNGLVLHALGVLKNGEVYVFLGPSGSGKTTVAQLSPEYTILSDDIVFIKPFGRSYVVFPTPCWGDMQRGDRENKGYPLKMMFKLVKDTGVYLKPYGLAQAISEIFTVPHIPQDSLPMGDLLNRYQGLLRKVPCFEMHFTKDRGFWQSIESERLNLT
ncbi:MAG: hypothetical protein KAJ09_07055 [Deltaproteobacteria bacterium]|nr:hypothetical protein [Deltaproteobacteria bacterium]